MWYLNAVERWHCGAALEFIGISLEETARNPGGGAPAAAVLSSGTVRRRWNREGKGDGSCEE
jgi:hypothetical protein